MRITFDVTYRHDPESKAVRFNHGKPWLEEDMALLKDHFLKGASLAELCCVCQRGASGVIARMEFMKLIQGSWTDDYYNVLVQPPTKGEPAVATETDDEYLRREYVLTLENESTWHNKTRGHVEAKDYDAYFQDTEKFVVDLMRERRDTTIAAKARSHGFRLIPRMVRRVALALWHDEYPIHAGEDYGVLYSDHYASISGLSTANANPTSPVTETLEEPIMSTINTNNSIAIEVKTLVFGQDASTMTVEQLIEAVRRVESAIEDLKKVKTSSKKIEKMIADQEAHLTSLVAVLDAK